MKVFSAPSNSNCNSTCFTALTCPVPWTLGEASATEVQRDASSTRIFRVPGANHPGLVDEALPNSLCLLPLLLIITPGSSSSFTDCDAVSDADDDAADDDAADDDDDGGGALIIIPPLTGEKGKRRKKKEASTFVNIPASGAGAYGAGRLAFFSVDVLPPTRYTVPEMRVPFPFLPFAANREKDVQVGFRLFTSHKHEHIDDDDDDDDDVVQGTVVS
ncbi:uncharacterized protein SEPMUDRAFT_108453 [Sphaerulina musiva SO2202]|uniref:Uncharacterized protein n=1 Tax=Sphaerulina musiva (strain SO2202) TaxID=692275 RepID=M3CGU2_SPHMS|nr:uncharacterized protein SEPMUDRAFT_108453 [Sphaerulina musiva SO2202]EMF13033.1 hypothetical protein SEPMUDRAFT_108453 [Sphaerulina musiva SO2202]